MPKLIVPKTVIGYHITAQGHIWIDGVMGGFVAMSSSGKYYTEKTLQKALNDYDKRYRQYLKEYMGV